MKTIHQKELLKSAKKPVRNVNIEHKERLIRKSIQGAALAAEIIKTLDCYGLTIRTAHARTGIAVADFSRIRNADLARFTLHRLVGIINRLGSRIEVKLKVKPAAHQGHAGLA